MTIEKINWQGVSCVWYERGNSTAGLQHTPRRQHFDADTLMPYQRPLTATYLQQRPQEALVPG